MSYIPYDPKKPHLPANTTPGPVQNPSHYCNPVHRTEDPLPDLSDPAFPAVDNRYQGEPTAQANLYTAHHPLPRMHSGLSGLPYGIEEEWDLLPGEVPPLYDTWGLWS